MNIYRFIAILLMLCAGSAFTVSPALAAGDDWLPIDAATLSLKTPVVEKDADAEAIFWEVRVNDENYETVLSHYIRIKVFTERGKESQSTVEIPFARGRVKDISGRTIKPDGSIVELKKDAIFERTIVKAGDVKIKVKSFVMPSVEPGCIIEYRWREVRRTGIYMRFYLQREIPVQMVKYYIKPLQSYTYGMRSLTFNGRNAGLEKDKGGYYSATMTNVPAFHEEPRMPPEDQVRSWILIFYTEDSHNEPDKYWNSLGKEMYSKAKDSMKVNDEVRKAAAEIIGDATTPDQKLERLYDYCRLKIKNTDDDASGLTDDDRSKLKENKNPSDTIKRGMGTGSDIDMLFAALASAAGFDSRMALIGDRSDLFFTPTMADSYFLGGYNIAVKVGEKWRFFDPASTYVPFGMLRWAEEGMQALVTDSKNPVFIETPLSPADKSLEKRTAKLRLDADGTLEGDVRIEYTGHLGAAKKEYNDDDSPEQREQTLLDMVKERMSTAELTDIHIENITDPVKPFVYSYHVRVPGYAQRTGKRLFIQPAFFQKGVGALFQTSVRKYPIYFHHPWSEEDSVEIELPEGFLPDNPEAPGSLNVENLGKYEVTIGLSKDKRVMVYSRKADFSGMLYQPDIYPQLKQIFDVIHENDNHTITFKQGAFDGN